MKIYDYHTHTNFSEDCKFEMEDMIKGAIDKEITELCFTEHHDHDYPEEGFEFILDQELYMSTFYRLKEKYEDQISLKLGIELGLQRHVIHEAKKFIHEKEYDFIIASQHCVENKDLYTKDYFKGKTTDEIFKGYFDEMYHNLTQFQDFDIVGHIDLLRRYSPEVANYDLKKSYPELTKILKYLIDNGKGIEVNAGGFYYPALIQNPHIEILQLYKNLGGEIITFGSDAHRPARLASHYLEVMRLLKENGFNYLTKFDKRKPTFVKIDI